MLLLKYICKKTLSYLGIYTGSLFFRTLNLNSLAFKVLQGLFTLSVQAYFLPQYSWIFTFLGSGHLADLFTVPPTMLNPTVAWVVQSPGMTFFYPRLSKAYLPLKALQPSSSPTSKTCIYSLYHLFLFYLYYIPTYVLHINLISPRRQNPTTLKGESTWHYCYLIAWAQFQVQKLTFTKLQWDFSRMSLNSQ